ncbi:MULTISPECIES: rhomboid family intramembrane serine protease [unclassified Synechococcus]|uniref:rhomboid family intramembrane serine protease n=1 Tax=unclassified Synechococcus TaxID=2626047 RepID=UPI0020007940|nr:rhomboid family intramembrane serine protease [Synechococcus sp. A10-1-5-1]UPM50593.1 rhomboid family intramembrane serine protease [Synechococcus sp. A10-1-5-1]
MTPSERPLGQELKAALLIPVVLLAIAWLQEGIDQILFRGQWNLPMLPGGSALGILTAPFSHGGWGHLLANSTMFLPLSWLVCFKSKRDYVAVWFGVLITTIPVWLWWRNGSHGLSGVIYGLLGYLLLIGWLERRPLSMLLSVSTLVLYGGVLPSLLPLFTPAGVSWIGHAGGFTGGLLAAAAVSRSRP